MIDYESTPDVLGIRRFDISIPTWDEFDYRGCPEMPEHVFMFENMLQLSSKEYENNWDLKWHHLRPKEMNVWLFYQSYRRIGFLLYDNPKKPVEVVQFYRSYDGDFENQMRQLRERNAELLEEVKRLRGGRL